MNTPTLIAGILLLIGVIWALAYTIKLRRESQDTIEKRFYGAYILAIIFFLCMSVVMVLNSFGIARLPLINEVRNRMPESFTPSTPVTPPTNGSVQPSSKPAFDAHKEQMEKLKRDGF